MSKIVHILCIVPSHLLSHLSKFNTWLHARYGVNHSLSDLIVSYSPHAIGGLGIHQASDMVYAAYLGRLQGLSLLTVVHPE